jgi:prevent-host-death family protein
MKAVKIAELKARLSQYLREVKRGHSFTVMDRETPIATVTPYESGAELLRVRGPAGRFATPQDVPLPAPLKTKVDVVDLLLEERGER